MLTWNVKNALINFHTSKSPVSQWGGNAMATVVEPVRAVVTEIDVCH
jgi:hypothetical protein